jgi:hypothetical protein
MPKGRKTGGRQAGTPNAVTATLREQVEQAAGGRPLPVLLAEVGTKAMKEGDYQLAVTAYAKAAAYVYPRMATADPPAPPLPPVVVSFADPRPCNSCGHDPKDRVHITREILHGPPRT